MENGVCNETNSNWKAKQMELEIEKLEGELREALTIEATVSSVAAEHEGSCHKGPFSS